MIELPDAVVPNSADPVLMDFGGVLRPALGGKLQRVDRLGNRFKVRIGLPPLPNADMGRIVVARLIKAKSRGLRIEYPLCGIDQGSPGAPLISGAGQAGEVIALKGLRPGYGAGEGFWFSIETEGQHFLYNVAEPARADSGGEMEMSIWPPLRRPPDDNDVVHLQRPMIEGLVLGDEIGWSISLAHHIGMSFEIEEAE